MIKKHSLFLAVLCSGEGLEKKITCSLDQVLLTNSILSNGQWHKAFLVQSFVTTMLWSLQAINAHWCWLALSQDEDYVLLLLEDSISIIPAVEPLNPPVAVGKKSYAIDSDGNPGDKQEDELEGDGVGCENDLNDEHSLLFSFKSGSMDMEDIKETLQHILQMLDTSDGKDLATGNDGSWNLLSTKE